MTNSTGVTAVEVLAELKTEAEWLVSQLAIHGQTPLRKTLDLLKQADAVLTTPPPEAAGVAQAVGVVAQMEAAGWTVGEQKRVDGLRVTTMHHPEAAGARREDIARIVDPKAWTEVECAPEDRAIWAKSRQMDRDKALAKADAILALPAPSAPPCHERETPVAPPIGQEGLEIRCPDSPGIIDEIVARGVALLHVEQMSADSWFMGLDMADGTYHQFWFGAKNRKSHVEFRHTETVTAQEAAQDQVSRDTAPPPHSQASGEVLVDLAAHVIKRENVCGLTIKGEHVLCDHPEAGESRRNPCECRQTARAVVAALSRQAPQPNGEAAQFKWGEDYGKDLLTDLNQLAHAKGTSALLRDALQRAYKEIFRSRQAPQPADMPSTSAEYHQQRGAAWDIVDEALETYNGFMLDDDYDYQGILSQIMERMKERRALYHPAAPTAQGKA